jgi:hypothetical protein
MIDLVPSTAPIYKRPYKMVAKQLAEPKDQIKQPEQAGKYDSHS